MEKQELELWDGFRRLCPADRNMVMTAVSMVLSAEAARRENSQTLKCPICGTETYHPTDDMSPEKEICRN